MTYSGESPVNVPIIAANTVAFRHEVWVTGFYR